MKEMLDKMPILNNLIFMYHLGIAGIYMKRFEIQKSEEELKLINDFFVMAMSLQIEEYYIILWNLNF